MRDKVVMGLEVQGCKIFYFSTGHKKKRKSNEYLVDIKKMENKI